MTWEVEHIGPHTLYRGDCREVMPTLPDVSAVVTDPPYGCDLGVANNPRRQGGKHGYLGKRGYLSYEDTYANFVEKIVPRLNMALDRVRTAAVFTGQHIHEQRKHDNIGGIYSPAATGRTAWGSRNFLPVLFYGIPPYAGLHRPTVVWSCATAEASAFPCAKPLAWMRWLVNLASLSGAVVLDPFMGSGTTGVACVQLGRVFTGIEIERQYFDIACQRMHDALAQPDLFLDQRPRPTQQPLFAGGH